MGSAFCVIVALVVGFVIVNAILSGGAYGKLLKRGLPARGILLKVSSLATRVGTQRLERRTVTVDVEVPGQLPYEVSASVWMATNLRGVVLPGATVELRVDPKNRAVIAVIGPGVAIPAAPFLAAPASTPQLNPPQPGAPRA